MTNHTTELRDAVRLGWMRVFAPKSDAQKHVASLRPYRSARPPWWNGAKILLLLALAMFCLVYGFAFALTAPYLILQFLLPIIFLGGIAIWALPDFNSAPTGWLEFLFFSFFISLIVWPNYLALTPPGMPWITMIRLTGFPLLFILLICVSTSRSFREETASTLQAAPQVWKLLTAFVVVQVLSVALSDNIGHSINKLIVTQISWTAIFFTSCYVFSKPGMAQRWAFLLCTTALIVGVIGLWEYKLGHLPWAGHIPSFLKIEDEAVLRILSGQQRAAVGTHRVQSVFSTSLGLAELLALAVPFLLYFAASSYHLAIRTAALLTVPVLLFVVFTTDSRLGMVGFLLAVMLYPLFWGLLRWRRNKGSVFGPAIVLAYPALFCIGIASTFVVGRIRNRIWGTGAHQASNEGRISQYADGIPLVIQNPLGHGIGMGAEALGYTNLAGVSTIDTYYLLIALEYGILGFVLYYAMLIFSAIHGARHAMVDDAPDRDTALLVPTTISIANFFVIKSVFSNQDNHPLIFMMMGLAVALAHRVQTRQSLDSFGSVKEAQASHTPGSRQGRS